MSDLEEWLDIFQEPSDFYESKKGITFEDYKLTSGQTVVVRLVEDNHPLWGHLLWNAGRVISGYLEQHAESLARHRLVLELGAGSGLPSLVCALCGASRVVVTDYPDADLVDNLRHNISANKTQLPSPDQVFAEGYLWGSPTEKLLSHLPADCRSTGFDTLILADLLFNHSEHGKLIWTVCNLLTRREDAVALVFFTPYRPWLLQKDLSFFDLAKAQGLVVRQVCEKVLDENMFPNDPGDERLRRTVFGYELRWREFA